MFTFKQDFILKKKFIAYIVDSNEILQLLQLFLKIPQVFHQKKVQKIFIKKLGENAKKLQELQDFPKSIVYEKMKNFFLKS